MSDQKYIPDLRAFEDAFPQIECGAIPLGSRIIVQLRKTGNKSKGGIIIVPETKDTIKYNEVVAKVVKLGPLAYKSPDTLEPWKEGSWVNEGDLVRVIKWGGDRWSVPAGDGEFVHFITINADEVIAKIPDYEAARLMIPFVEQ